MMRFISVLVLITPISIPAGCNQENRENGNHPRGEARPCHGKWSRRDGEGKSYSRPRESNLGKT